MKRLTRKNRIEDRLSGIERRLKHMEWMNAYKNTLLEIKNFWDIQNILYEAVNDSKRRIVKLESFIDGFSIGMSKLKRKEKNGLRSQSK